MSKKILFISRHAPYGSSLAKDALDALLASAAYDQDLGLLLMDDGVLQLVAGQNADLIHQKNFANILPVLELYDVEKIYVHKGSLLKRGIEESELINLPLILLDSDEVADLINSQQQILSF